MGYIQMRWVLLAGAAFLSISASSSASAGTPANGENRLKLPIPESVYSGNLDAEPRASSPPVYPSTPSAPPGAPNIIVIMTDDVGFGASSTFGGPVPTPTFDSLAHAGLRYNNFHTNGVCSPTRAALLTGRNAHSVGSGTIQEGAMGYPGYNSVLPRSAATFGRVLRDNGYSTAWFGKHHNVPDWQTSRAGPFDRWPNGLGFEYFFGFIGGETDQWAPALIENTVPVEPPANDPTYILDRDLADHALGWLRSQSAAAPQKPFLIYYAPGSAHSPNQAPPEWILRFRGKFDQGWDKVREETFARQKAQGIIPPSARLTVRPPELPAWDMLPPKARAVASRLMETHAAQLAYCDNQIGRLIDELKRTGKYENTLIVFIQGDNGAEGSAGIDGKFNMTLGYNGESQSIAEMFESIDLIGGPKSNGLYPAGWAWAMNAPFQWMKQHAGFFGAVRNGMVMSWPAKINRPGGVRQQFGHVIDIAPTLYEAAGVPAPSEVDGVAQMPVEGVSLMNTLNSPKARSNRDRQYFEMFGNRGIYDKGWMAVVHPLRMPWETLAAKPNAPPIWELYHVDQDYSQSTDLAAKNPRKLQELIAIFDQEARRNNVYPLFASVMDKINTPRPYLIDGQSTFIFRGRQSRLPRSAFPDLLNKSWTMSANVRLDMERASGMVATQGGYFGGWGLMFIGGQPAFIYKRSHREQDVVRLMGPPLQSGLHHVVVDFAYDGGGLGKGGLLTMSVDERQVGSVRLDRTIQLIIPGEANIGIDTGQALTDDYRLPFTLTGEVEEIQIKPHK